MDLDFDKNENKKEDDKENLISEKLLEDDFELDESLDNLPI